MAASEAIAIVVSILQPKHGHKHAQQEDSYGTYQASVEASSAVKGELNAMLKHCIQQRQMKDHAPGAYYYCKGERQNAAHQLGINCPNI